MTSKKNFVRKPTTNDAGIPSVVLVPDDETDLRRGIPVSLNLHSLYGHMPESFQRDLYQALHDNGLIEPADFFKPGAADRYARALRTVIKHDFLSVQTLAHEEMNNG